MVISRASLSGELLDGNGLLGQDGQAVRIDLGEAAAHEQAARRAEAVSAPRSGPAGGGRHDRRVLRQHFEIALRAGMTTPSTGPENRSFSGVTSSN